MKWTQLFTTNAPFTSMESVYFNPPELSFISRAKKVFEHSKLDIFSENDKINLYFQKGKFEVSILPLT